MKILAVGGGSGGHVTPLVAVLKSVRDKSPRARVKVWCDRKFYDQAKGIVENYDDNISVEAIVAGKFRRYHHLSVLQQITWPSLVLANIRDSFLVLIGIVQSFFKLLAWKPDVIFTKGGYVCLPVGIAARMLNIPLVIHDSDAYPGLTNRVLSKWSSVITTGAPLDFYSYPKDRSYYVGIPIADEFYDFDQKNKKTTREAWGIDINRPLVVITGGGLGATRINDAVVFILKDLLKKYSVVLVSGNGQYDELRSIVPRNDSHFQLHGFIAKDMYSLLGTADLVVTRAGATTILELAALKKPAILIPNAKLTGGHQLKNAKVYADKNAVEIVDENEMEQTPEVLYNKIDEILNDENKLSSLSANIAEFACPKASEKVAELILSAAHK